MLSDPGSDQIMKLWQNIHYRHLLFLPALIPTSDYLWTF